MLFAPRPPVSFLGSSWAGGLLGSSGAFWGFLDSPEALLGLSKALVGPPGALLACSWALLDSLGLSWASPGALVGLSWCSLGALLGSPGFSLALLGSPGAPLGLGLS